MSGYHSSSEISGMRAPRKPLLKSVALPANSPMNSPIALNFPRNESARPSRFPWVSASLPSRSQTPVPPPTRHPNLSFQEAAVEPPGNPLAYQTSSRTRKTSVSSNISDFAIAPLKGILKKTGSSTRSSTPAPSTRNHVPPVKPEATMHAISTSSGESNLGHRYHHRRAESKTSSSSSSKVDGYSSDSHMLWNRKVSHDGDASRPAYGNGKPLGGHRRATPSAVPMKAEAIALNWPLREPERSPRKQRLNICFDVAFDPRVTKGVTVPYDTDIAHRKDMSHDDIRLPASTHCTLTEMRIFLDLEEFKCWPIKVKRKEGVRCLDVYEAIYKTLQHRLTDDDVRTFGLPDYNKQRGIRRVDLLEGRRFFRGLVQSGEDWKLHLG